MSDYRITGLSAITTPASGDLLVMVDVDGTAPPTGAGGSDVKITFANLVAAILASPAMTGTVTTAHSTLDDGSGNATFAGNLVVNNPVSYANGTFVGAQAGGQYSNFNLADNIYPLDASGHYWSFSHRQSAHELLIYNYNGSAYTTVLTVTEAANAQFSGLVSLNGGSDTSGTATESAPTFTTATAMQCSTTQDVELYICVTTTATFTIAYGPTSSPAYTIVNNKSLTAGQVVGLHVPKSWYVEITGTIADLSVIQVTC